LASSAGGVEPNERPSQRPYRGEWIFSFDLAGNVSPDIFKSYAVTFDIDNMQLLAVLEDRRRQWEGGSGDTR
jgi:hypothetical protein